MYLVRVHWCWCCRCFTSGSIRHAPSTAPPAPPSCVICELNYLTFSCSSCCCYGCSSPCWCCCCCCWLFIRLCWQRVALCHHRRAARLFFVVVTLLFIQRHGPPIDRAVSCGHGWGWYWSHGCASPGALNEFVRVLGLSSVGGLRIWMLMSAWHQ